MCIMLLKKKEQEFSPDYIQSIYEKSNRDGFGLAYVEGERNEEGKLIKPGRVKVIKSMGLASELKDIYAKAVQENPQAAFVVHLRNATMGDKTIENCHPSPILSIDDGDSIDLVMFHNGTIRDVQVNKSMSDSWNFATTHLRGILRERPSMLYEESFRYFLCSLLGTNKLIFMDNRERVSVINYELGSIHPATGVWLSTRENLQLPRPPAPMGGGRTGNQFGAGQTRSNPVPSSEATPSTISMSSSDAVSVVSSRPRMTWKQPEGSKWVMESDGRSHFIPAGTNVPADAEPEAQLLLPAAASDRAGYIEKLISDAPAPKTPGDIEALKNNLAKAQQVDLHNYVKNFPVESSYVLRYVASIAPNLLPEFADAALADIVEYCLESAWPAGFALGIACRGNVEAIHEVN